MSSELEKMDSLATFTFLFMRLIFYKNNDFFLGVEINNKKVITGYISKFVEDQIIAS